MAKSCEPRFIRAGSPEVRAASRERATARVLEASRRRARLHRLALALLTTTASTLAAAGSAWGWPISITGRATAWLGAPGPNDTQTFDHRFIVDPGFAEIYDAVHTGLGPIGGPAAAGAQSLSTAKHGLLGADAGAEVIDGSGVASASTSASFRDFFEVLPRNASLLGQPGTLSFVIGIAGDGDADQEGDPNSNQASASVLLTADVGGCGALCRFAEGMSWRTDLEDGHTIVEGQSSLAFAITGSVPIVFGTLVRVDVALSTDASVFTNDGSASAYANFGHTAWWGGILEVRDAQGELVAYTARSSDTLIDWSESMEPVPEPGRGVMLLLGVASLVARHRSSRTERVDGGRHAHGSNREVRAR